MLGVTTVASGKSRRVSASTVSSSTMRWPVAGIMTGSTTTFSAPQYSRRSATASTISGVFIMPMRTAAGRMSSKQASICAAIISGGRGSILWMPRVFCASTAVMAHSP